MSKADVAGNVSVTGVVISWHVHNVVTSNTTNTVLCMNISAQRDIDLYNTESRKIQAGKQELEAVNVLEYPQAACLYTQACLGGILSVGKEELVH